jgi:hypothetical protein
MAERLTLRGFGPASLPAAQRIILAQAATVGVATAMASGVEGGDQRRRIARLHAMKAAQREPVAAPPLKQGLCVLIDAAEDLVHGAAGEMSEAGISAARARHGCECDEAFLRILRAMLDLAVESAFQGIRSAALRGASSGG